MCIYGAANRIFHLIQFELPFLKAKVHQFIRQKQGLVNFLFPEPLDNHIEVYVNLAQIKFFGMFISALCKV